MKRFDIKAKRPEKIVPVTPPKPFLERLNLIPSCVFWTAGKEFNALFGDAEFTHIGIKTIERTFVKEFNKGGHMPLEQKELALFPCFIVVKYTPFETLPSKEEMVKLRMNTRFDDEELNAKELFDQMAVIYIRDWDEDYIIHQIEEIV